MTVLSASMAMNHDKADSGKSALVVQGGAMRSVFSAGILDAFLEKKFNPFDFYIGVSAGASNLAAFLSGTPGTSLKIFQDYACRAEFINYPRFLRNGHLIDLDWLFDVVFRQSPLNLASIYSHARPLYVCVTNVVTGRAVYVETNPDNLLYTLKASTALPVFYRNFPVIDGHIMTDGGVADAIPVARAIALGARRIMVLRTRPKDYIVKDTLVHRWVRWQMRNYPQLHASMQRRVIQHREALRLIRNPPPGVKVIEVCPPHQFSAGRFNRKTDMLHLGYQSGLELADSAIQQWLMSAMDR
jgi:predicted patatin/cPLA2 family phospholipase